MANARQMVLAEVKPLAGGEILHKKLEDLTPNEAATAYAAVSFVASKLDLRKKALASLLKDLAQKLGESNSKGGQILPTEAAVIHRERRESHKPDGELTLRLINDRGIDKRLAFDEVTVLEPNPSKLKELVETGLLNQEEFDLLYPVNFAIRVTPNGELELALTEAAKRYDLNGVTIKAPSNSVALKK